VSNPAVPDIVLQYTTFEQITDDISDARVYGGYIFEPIRSQASAWETPSARPCTRTTYVACTMTMSALFQSDSPFVSCDPLIVRCGPRMASS